LPTEENIILKGNKKVRLDYVSNQILGRIKLVKSCGYLFPFEENAHLMTDDNWI